MRGFSSTINNVIRESLSILSGNLRFQENLRNDFELTPPTMRSALVEAIGAWRAEAILGPAPLTTITIRKPPRYYTSCEDWMV